MAKRIQLPDGSIGEFPDDMPDEEIASVLTDQFPPTQNAQQAAPEAPQAPQTRDWGDVPAAAIRNAPRSAANFAGDVWNAVTSPVQTAKGMLDLGAGALRAGAGKVAPSLMNYIDRFDNPETTQRLDQTAEGAGQFLKNRYGSEAALRETIGTDPVGALGDLSTLLTGGATLAPKAGMVASTLSKAAKLTDPINLAARTAGATARGAGNVAANVAGNMSGAGGDALKIAYETGVEGGGAGRSFRENMRGAANPEEIVSVARENLDAIRQDRNATYQQNSAGWKGANAPINFAPVESAFNSMMSSMQHRGKFKVGAPQQAVLSEIDGLIQSWKADPGSHTVVGLDALKQRINDIPYDRVNAPSAGRGITQIRDAISRQIRSAAPDYAKTMDDWGRQSKELDDITKSLSLGDKVSIDSSLRKLSSVMRNNVNTNFGKRNADLEKLVDAGGRPLKPAIAGQTLNTWMPRGIQNATAMPLTAIAAGVFHPSVLAGIAAESPRFSGEIAHKIGQAARFPTRTAESLAPYGRGISGSLTGVQSLSDLYTEDEALMELKRRRR